MAATTATPRPTSRHGVNGRIVLPVLAVLMIVAAALARAGRRTIWLAVLPLGLLIVQTLLFILTGVLFGLDESSHAAPPLGATLFNSLHGVNGAAILIASIALVLRSRRVLREGPPAPRAERETSPAEATAAAAAAESESVQS